MATDDRPGTLLDLDGVEAGSPPCLVPNEDEPRGKAPLEVDVHPDAVERFGGGVANHEHACVAAGVLAAEEARQHGYRAVGVESTGKRTDGGDGWRVHLTVEGSP